MSFSVQGALRTAARLAAALAIVVTAGCATTGPAGGQAANPKDPLEPFNRKMFAFNDALDTYALKPAATAYVNVIPSPVRTGVHNFFGNFSDAWSAVNQLLQGKPDDSARMTMRVLTNTIIGIGGLFDPATPLGLERKSEDLGQTFGRWGAPPGPYVVLPLFGPSDVRDAIALPADTYVAPALLVDSTWQKIGVDAVGVIDARANLLGASQMLDDIALDRYSFLRDAYVARRRSLVYDGNPPDDPHSRDDEDDVGPTPPSAPAPAGPASGAKSSQADTPATLVVAGGAPVAQLPPSAPSAPSPSPVPGSVTPAPLPASAPPLPVPLPGPAPVPPPPASGAHR
jgi:phospholipid-binding lipoprotein MlaA